MDLRLEQIQLRLQGAHGAHGAKIGLLDTKRDETTFFPVWSSGVRVPSKSNKVK